jgi:hypothetical protein
MKVLIVIAISLLVAAQLASAACHNATGSCSPSAFVCANEEAIPHNKRCDGVEDCADGTDEYMCDQAPTPLFELAPRERNAITEVSCVKCTCFKTTIVIQNSAGAWWTIAQNAPRDKQMMTDAPAQGNKPCMVANTLSITLNVYKKQNKGCRGWVCCFRQQLCTCTVASGKTSATHCY